MALLGGRLGWHRMVRTGAAVAHIESAPPEPPVATVRRQFEHPGAATTGVRWPLN
jgi:hypothetical protein